MLSGFANNNRGFINRTRAINQNFANAIGSGKLIDPKILGYTPKKCSAGSCPTGLCCLRNGTLVSTGETANWCISCADFSKFDGGFANAIGTPTKFNPVGYVPSKCVGGRCPSGMCCLKNGTNIATGVTADWCVPCSDFQKFDGGFNYAHGGFHYAHGGCGDNGMLGL